MNKPKIPPVPTRSLQDCLEDVRKLYEQYGHSNFSKAEIASVLRLSATSGAFNPRLFALKQFGLLDQYRDEFRASKLFMDLKTLERDSSAFKQRALDAINGSDIFSEMLREFKMRLPTVSMIAQRLETQKQFNPERAKLAATVFEQSLRYAGVLDANNNIMPVRDAPMREAARDVPETGHGGNHVQPPGKPTEDMEENHLRLEVPLTNSRKVTIWYPEDVNADEVVKIQKMLAGFITMLEAATS